MQEGHMHHVLVLRCLVPGSALTPTLPGEGTLTQLSQHMWYLSFPLLVTWPPEKSAAYYSSWGVEIIPNGTLLLAHERLCGALEPQLFCLGRAFPWDRGRSLEQNLPLQPQQRYVASTESEWQGIPVLGWCHPGARNSTF